MTSTKDELLEKAVNAMTDPNQRSMYDVTIICCTDDHQAEFWMKHLSEGLLKKTSGEESKFPMVLAVSEDWAPGGAGNGLGTLYAYQKACKLAKETHDIDLSSLLKEGTISASLYHTAGKGTRLAPLPASENNNKPGVKLPFCQQMVDGSYEPITVLEAVIKQTGVYALSRKGRLSVFWGDQVFIPSVSFEYKPSHHIDILCTLLGDTAPTASEWKEQGLDKYGVIAVLEDGNAAQVEKVDHATATEMLQSLGNISRVGPSLGSFSVSSEILNALCEEFDKELNEKTAALDTDPHFWMPLTLPQTEYVSLMKQKGIDDETSIEHHKRMTSMKDKFDLSGKGLFGAVDVGKDAGWWDYGQIKLYSKYNLHFMNTDDNDAMLLRKFLGITSNVMNSSIVDDVKVDDKSCIFNCTIKSGSVSESVLGAVISPNVEADGAIIVNCTAKKIKAGKGSILYNIIDTSDEGIVANENDVIVNVMDENGSSYSLKSNMDIDGKKAWKQVLDGNPMSFEDVNKKNSNSNVTLIEKKRHELYKAAVDTYNL